MKKSVIWLLMIVSELILGITLGLIFIKYISNWDIFFGGTYFSGIFRYYSTLSLIFFISVFLVGFYGVKKINRSEKLKSAIFYSIGSWIISLVLYSNTYSYFFYDLQWRTLPEFILLIGIIMGFNLGLLSNKDYS
jgi:hypothetical protein